MAYDPSGAASLANEALTSLLEGKDFNLPDVNLDDPDYALPPASGVMYGEISPLTNEDLTTRVVGGGGVFDALMDGISAHLRKEYESNRITGNEYTKAYIGVVGPALGAASQFLLSRDQAYWASILAQQQARAAEVQLVTARVMLATAKASLAAAHFQALTAEAEYGLTKMKLATEDAQFVSLSTDIKSKEYTNQWILPAQKDLVLEQVEVQRAQTLDTRVNGAVIRGSVGKQKDLYDQQITSYKRDAEVKAAKIFSDAWITQKTIDEGLTAPAGFTNASLDTILTRLKANNQLT